MQGSVFSLGSLIISKRVTISLNRLKYVILWWRFVAGNSMKRAFENQECIKVSLPCVYNCFLVLKTENRSLLKAINVSNLSPSFPWINVRCVTMSLDGSPCLIRNYLRSKFNENRVIFEGQRTQTARNTPRRGHISWMLDRTQKGLKIYNLTTASATPKIHKNYVPHTL